MLEWFAGGGPMVDNGRVTSPESGGTRVVTQLDDDVYCLSRSVLLPRVALRQHQQGMNPLFIDDLEIKSPPGLMERISNGQSSSGYGSNFSGSSQCDIYSGTSEDDKTTEEDVYNSPPKTCSTPKHDRTRRYSKRSVVSLSSGQGTLSTIPEGKVHFTIPRPVWPWDGSRKSAKNGDRLIKNSDESDSKSEQLDNVLNDSLLSDSLLLFTSYERTRSNSDVSSESVVSTREILEELSQQLTLIVDGKCEVEPQEALKVMQVKIVKHLEELNQSTEDDIRKLGEGISNNERLVAVSRAFNRESSSSGNSTAGSNRSLWKHISGTISCDEELYQVPSASSSSGFSELIPTPPSTNAAPEYRQVQLPSPIYGNRTKPAIFPNGAQSLPIFVHEDLSNASNSVRNVMIYGTLCRSLRSSSGLDDQLIPNAKNKRVTIEPMSQRELAHQNKPSLWEIYYTSEVDHSEMRPKIKDSDVPYFPAGGRPEADFTLDLPRAELLMRKMDADKRWRCRCRFVTSVLGLVFFLLSVMAVSLVLTRGQRMFGSMV